MRNTVSSENPTSYTGALTRDIKAEMVAFMLDRPGGCTREDLLQDFSPRQIDQYGSAAAREAKRRAERRLV